MNERISKFECRGAGSRPCESTRGASGSAAAARKAVLPSSKAEPALDLTQEA